jgi:hypothetical protein
MDYGIDEYGARCEKDCFELPFTVKLSNHSYRHTFNLQMLIIQLMAFPFPISVTVSQPQIVSTGFVISGFPNL